MLTWLSSTQAREPAVSGVTTLMIKRGTILAVLAAGAAAAVPVQGRWEGTLNLGGKNLRMGFDLKEQGAVLMGTLNSPDQGLDRVPVSGKLKNQAAILGVERLNGVFTGKLSPDGTALDGKWKQGGWKRLVLTRFKGAGPGVLGDWKGTLPAGQKGSRMVFRFTKEKGQLVGRMDSLDAGPKNLRFTATRLMGKKLFIRSTNLGAEFNATLRKDGKTLDGHWWQGIELPLTLRRR